LPLDVDDSTSLKCLIVPDNIDAISGESWTIILVKHFCFTDTWLKPKTLKQHKKQTKESSATSEVKTKASSRRKSRMHFAGITSLLDHFLHGAS